jgi:bifunctional non-homologous end joining protein LigD
MPSPKKPAAGDALATYRAKRSADRTPEPFGAAPSSSGGLFVVHQHAATRLHCDLRLEMDGVLWSWAVPKGPSKNPADKRLAVHVEDHPLEYGDFEGVIPEGNYGAGSVIVWDRGQWVPLEDPHAGLEKGKLLFDLRGHKLKGRWTLVKIKKGQKEWLLIKERDALVSLNGDDFPPGSVLSGLTVEEVKHAGTRAEGLRKELARLKAPKRALRAKDVPPMLAETRERAFTKESWLFELKLDGYRLTVGREGGEAKLLSRNGHDLTVTFPEAARAVEALPFDGLVMDGEIVCHDASGHPSFGRLQQRGRLTKAADVRRAAVELPATLYLFDLTAAEGFDLRDLPLTTRKEFLRRVVPAAGALKYLDHFETRGEDLYAQVTSMGLEGIVAKKADSPYRSRRSAEWLKIRADRTDDFVVVGFTRPKGSRSGFGALHVAQYEDGTLTYTGRVGSGFDAKQLDEVGAGLEKSRRAKPSCEGSAPKDRESVWVEPDLVCEVRFKEFTDDGLLRQPVFLRWRDDKPKEECVRRGSGVGFGVSESPPSVRSRERSTPHTPHPTPPVQFTNLDKVFWPSEGYTKGDLVAYYRAIAPWLLPYLEDRPVVLTRYPDGITGKSFFQKDAPEYAHDYVRTVRMWSGESQRELNYFVAETEPALLYIANMAAIPLHIWGSRVATLETPDWCILDLDPKDAPFAHVVTIAKMIRGLCEEIALPCFIKTSGSSGLHVLIPVGRQCTYEQTRTLGGLLARLVAAELPEIATVTRLPAKREGKVYVDFVQNGHGRLLAAPFSVRPLPGAPVSMPLRWSEVGPKLAIGNFTIKNAAARMAKLKADPLRPILDLAPDLPQVLERLHARFGKKKAKR